MVNSDHIYHLYVILSEQRDELRAFLREHGIETGLHYPVPINRQPCLATLKSTTQAFP